MLSTPSRRFLIQMDPTTGSISIKGPQHIVTGKLFFQLPRKQVLQGHHKSKQGLQEMRRHCLKSLASSPMVLACCP